MEDERPAKCMKTDADGGFGPGKPPMKSSIIVRRGEETPPSFASSAFLALDEDGGWVQEAVELLDAAGFDKGVVFVGDGEAEGDSGWRSNALNQSDVIVCCKATLFCA